jgi:16S rRNA (cytosine1402-N4)-methyltransferase
MTRPHISVMEKEFLNFFEGRDLKVFFEGTVGAGGHAKAILEAHPEIECYFACDRDPQALEIARETLAPWSEKVQFIHGNFSDLDLILKGKKVDGFFLISEFHLCN